MTVKTTTSKLFELYKAIKPIKKDSVNPHFKNRYFDINTLIAEIKPITEKIGLIITQPLAVVDGRNAIITVISDADTGDVIAQSTALLPDNPDPQKMGSAITYFRRYSLQSLLLLEAEDDDGNSYNAPQQPLKRNFEPSRAISDNDLSYKVCPYCQSKHHGQYPKCMECYKKEKDTGIKLEKPKAEVVDHTMPPF